MEVMSGPVGGAATCAKTKVGVIKIMAHKISVIFFIKFIDVLNHKFLAVCLDKKVESSNIPGIGGR